MRRIRPLLSAELVLLLGLLALIGVGYLAERWLLVGQSAPVAPTTAIILASAPAIVWFLGLRAHEGELSVSPGSIVVLMFVGALLAGPAAEFVASGAVAPQPLVPPSTSPLDLASLVALGAIALCYEGAKFLSVRFLYLGSSRPWGDPLALLLAATAIALGVATFSLARELIDLGAVPLGVGAVRAAALVLIHTACAAIGACALITTRGVDTGAGRRAAVMLAGVLLAATLHVLFLSGFSLLEADGLTARPGRAAAVIALVAAVVLVGATLLAARLSRRAFTPPRDPEDSP